MKAVDPPAELVVCPEIPFAPPTVKQLTLQKRLAGVLGGDGRARLYGQIMPAVGSAIQAVGRAVSRPEDRAMLLADGGYRAIFRLLPRWFQGRVSERIDLRDVPMPLGGRVYA